MKTLRIILLAFAALLSLAALPAARAQDSGEPADQYFRGYLMKNQAETLEKSGDVANALARYQQMAEIFDGVAASFPTWQTDMVAKRRQLTQDAITRLKVRLSQPAPTSQMAAAPSSIDAAAATVAAAPSGLMVPTPGVLATPPLAVATSNIDGLPSLTEVFQQYESAYRQKFQELDLQNKQMQVDLGKWQTWYQWASGEITTARAEKDELAKRGAAMEEAVKKMEGEVAAGRAAASQLDALVKEKLAIEVEYRKTTQRLDAAEQASKAASQKLIEASSRVTDLELERNQYLAERDKAIKEKQEALKDKESADKIKDAAIKDRDTMSAQNLGLKSEIEQLKKATPAMASAPEGASVEMKQLLAENARLKKDLETAQNQMASLKKDVTRKDQELAGLRTQLTTLQTELTTLRQQSATYQTQVAELTMQLKQLKDAKPDSADPKVAQENTQLREIIMRQLRSQYRQQQVKDLVIAELQKMEGASADLLKQVEELKNARMILTPDEEKLFTDPQVKEMLGQQGIQGTLIASSGAKQADAATTAAAAPNEPANLLDQANEAFAARKFPEAAALYEDALRAEPKNTSALVGLGFARQREGRFPEAEAALKKCLAIEPDNEPAAFHLGVTYFKQQHWKDAMVSFEKSLAKNSQNASARHYLGIVATKLSLMERAEREFKTALAIDPNYGEAHFNLAVLYVTWDPPQWDKAQAEYDEALKKGVQADTALEKLLKDGRGNAVSKN